MLIYRIFNTETNENYIGQTNKTIEYRFKEHIREAKRALRGEMQNFPYFHRLLMFYGPEHFDYELIEEVEDSKADEREQYWIEYYNSYYEGYNSTKGGQNRPMTELNKESQQKWKQLDEKFKPIKKGGMDIQEVIAAGLYNPKNNCNAGKAVEQYDKQGNLLNIFPAASIAGKETNTSIPGIRNCCNENLQSSGGYIWRWAND